jgi:hypothetical protein
VIQSSLTTQYLEESNRRSVLVGLPPRNNTPAFPTVTTVVMMATMAPEHHNMVAPLLYNPKLRNAIEAVLTPCKECQKYKTVQHGHRTTAPRQTGLLPWSEIAVNTISPWALDLANQQVKFHVLMIIDLVTNLVEMVWLDNQTSAHVALQFTNIWLACYPKPTSCF